MNIACLGWGSLVWNPGVLPLRGSWHNDGPLLPIEFARKSGDGRITLVLVPGRQLVRSLWAMLEPSDLDEAKEKLRLREDIPKRNIDKNIGVWRKQDFLTEEEITHRIKTWAEPLGLDTVIWTALPPKFRGKGGLIPSAEDVVKHLKSLKGDRAKNAEHYIRMAPKQIVTDYRQIIEARLKWTPYHYA